MADSTNRWSSEVTERDRHDLPEGLFATGSAREIADSVLAAARNLSADRRATLEAAKNIVKELA